MLECSEFFYYCLYSISVYMSIGSNKILDKTTNKWERLTTYTSFNGITYLGEYMALLRYTFINWIKMGKLQRPICLGVWLYIFYMWFFFSIYYLPTYLCYVCRKDIHLYWQINCSMWTKILNVASIFAQTLFLFCSFYVWRQVSYDKIICIAKVKMNVVVIFFKNKYFCIS